MCSIDLRLNKKLIARPVKMKYVCEYVYTIKP
jgi:hypothetical protein